MMDIRYSASFWDYLEELAFSRHIKLDRPKGTCHQRYPDLVYSLEYCFLEGTAASDGGRIDVWQGVNGSHDFSGVIITFDLQNALQIISSTNNS